MTNYEAFKVGFLARASDEGLTTEETHLRVKVALATLQKKAYEKQAAGVSATGIPGEGLARTAVGLGADAVEGAAGLVKGITLPVAGLGLALAAGGGYLGGRTLAEARKDPQAAQEAATDELLAEYQRLTQRAQRRKELLAQTSQDNI